MEIVWNRLICICFFSCFILCANAQWFTTPQVLNGNPNETYYKSDPDNSRLYIGWDNTYLYIAKIEFSTRPVVIYFDLDPYFPVSGGSNANGNLTGVTHYNHTMDLPFRWDMCLYWNSTGSGTSYIEYKERNGTGGYTTQTESIGILEDVVASPLGTINAECRIKWSEINGSGGGRPASFNWYAYQFLPNASPGINDYVDQTMPYQHPGIYNPFGTISGINKVYFYQTVPNTNAVGTSDPMSFLLRSFETRGDYYYTSSHITNVYDLTIFKELGGIENLRLNTDIIVSNNLALSGAYAGLRSDGGNYTITMSGTNGIMHISNNAQMFGEYAGNLLYLTFNGYTTLQQIGSNTFDARIVTVIADKTLNANTASISNVSSMTATGNIDGTVITTNLSGFSGNSLSTFREGFTNWDIGINSLVRYADATLGTQTVTPRSDYGNVTIAGGGIKSFASETGNVTVNNTLTFENGMLYTGANKVIASNASTSAITGYTNTQYINGTLTRKVSSTGSYDFPVGNATQYELANIQLNTSAGLDSITVNYNTPAPLNPTGLTSSGSGCGGEITEVETFLNYGYWNFTPSGTITTLDYDITLNARGHSNAAALKENHGIFKNATLDAASWENTGIYLDDDCDADVTIVGGTSPVTITHTGNSSFSNFAIGLNDEFILPITLTTFSGWYNGVNNELHWLTSSEVNSDFFGIEKSMDGIVFTEIGMVPAQGFSSSPHNYLFYDESPLPGTQYYRLRMVDFDGTFEYSNITAINIDGSQFHNIVVYPNPADIFFNVEIIAATDTEIMCRLYDMSGRTVSQSTQTITTGKNIFQLDATLLTKSMYLLAITDLLSGEMITIPLEK